MNPRPPTCDEHRGSPLAEAAPVGAGVDHGEPGHAHRRGRGERGLEQVRWTRRPRSDHGSSSSDGADRDDRRRTPTRRSGPDGPAAIGRAGPAAHRDHVRWRRRPGAGRCVDRGRPSGGVGYGPCSSGESVGGRRVRSDDRARRRPPCSCPRSSVPSSSAPSCWCWAAAARRSSPPRRSSTTKGAVGVGGARPAARRRRQQRHRLPRRQPGVRPHGRCAAPTRWATCPAATSTRRSRSAWPPPSASTGRTCRPTSSCSASARSAAVAVLWSIQTSRPGGFEITQGAFASNAYGQENGRFFYDLPGAAIAEVVLTALFVIVILGVTTKAAVEGAGRARHRPDAHADPPDQHPDHQHAREPGPLARPGPVRGRHGARRSSGCSSSPRSSAACSGRSSGSSPPAVTRSRPASSRPRARRRGGLSPHRPIPCTPARVSTADRGRAPRI